ncbi:MAG: DUF3037 domain-containing protein [Burkholderiales bacterium]|nr:DUF3037 domain-containing protein [Burkholderiales bacterium]
MAVYDYFLLRLVPDQARGERLNAGIAVFTPAGVRLHLRLEAARVRALSPVLAGRDWAQQAAVFEARLNQSQDRRMQEFLLRTALAPLVPDERAGQLVANDEAELEQRVTALIDRFVARPAAPRRRREVGPTKLNHDVRQWLRRARLFSTNPADITKRRVVANYPIAANASLFAEFALQNGAIHVIETLDLRGLDHLSARRIDAAAYKSVLLDQAKEVSPEGHRIAIVASDDYGVARPALTMIGKYADDLVTFEQPADRQRLANFLAEALHLSGELAPLPVQ